GASIGSNFAKFFGSDEKIKIAVTGAGAAAAIAAIFNAPITGIIFTMEVIIGEWAAVYMLPVVIASVTATELSRAFHGNQIPFSHSGFDILHNDIFLSIGLAIFTAFVSVFFIRSLRKSSEYLNKFFPNHFIKALFAGLLIGIIIYFFPEVRGEGYKLVQSLITEQFEGGIIFLLLIIFLKIAATALTLNGGGAGGVFAPSLLLGSTTGILYYQIIQLFTDDISMSGPGLYALMGMAGVISGTLAAPLSGVFLIVEITSGYEAILPLMLISFLSSTVARLMEKHSIYHHELVKQGHLHRPRTDGRILADIHIEELLEKDMISVKPEMLLKEMIPIIKKSKRNYFPVIDSETEEFRGILYFNDLKNFIFSIELANSIFVEEIMDQELTTVSPSDTLMDIQGKFEQTRLWSLPVVKNGRFLGLISKATMLDLYRKELKVQTDK
ncbi:MAG: chloride channel protein, partial [Candidatus Marinimicrobia bacterium]|nr:chloride channel protein [Candidatus Neomarinimicrobiota bacterium]